MIHAYKLNGYNIILATQFDRLLDRQIRSLVEYEIIHRKINNYGFAGALLGLIFGEKPLFIRIEYWYPIKEKISVTFFKGKKKLYNLYDSYLNYEELNDKNETNNKDNNNITEIKRNNNNNYVANYDEEEDDDLTYIIL